MYDQPRRTLPEELLLACALPQTGLVKRPWFLNRVLCGAVFAELLLCGAITIEDDRITEVRPLVLGEPVVDDLLAQIVTDIRRGEPGRRRIRLVGAPEDAVGADPWQAVSAAPNLTAMVREAFRVQTAAVMPIWRLVNWLSVWPHFERIEERCLESMEKRGLVAADRRKVLGLFPRTTWRSLSPGDARETAAGVESVLRTYAPESSLSSPGIRRAHHLAALIGAADLAERLYPGREHRDTRKRVEQIAKGDPIAVAVRSMRDADHQHLRNGD